jgi:hypothetical protein
MPNQANVGLGDIAQHVSGMESDWFKYALAVIISGFIPLTVAAFLLVRRTKKKVEFGRMVQILDISATEGEFARDRVAEHYASSNYVLPVAFGWMMSLLGFYSLLFGADMVQQHNGKANILLTGLLTGDDAQMQAQRYLGMVILCTAFCGAFLWSMQNILRRLNAGDLTPMVYLSAGIRMTVAPVLALMVTNVLTSESGGMVHGNTLTALAFLAGFFPNAALQFLKERLVPLLGRGASGMAGGEPGADRLSLGMIEGVDVYDRSRLDELGIQDAQNLASANLIEIVARTSLNPIQVIDWIAQAKLYLYFKGDMAALRKSQIRSMFDMLPAVESETFLQEVAQTTGLSVVNLRHYCMALQRDPGAKRLLAFRERLSTPVRNADQVGSAVADVHAVAA